MYPSICQRVMLKYMAFSITNHLCFAWKMYKNVFSWSCYFAFIGLVVRLVHIVVHCENMYNVQLSSQILFSQLHVRSFKSFGAAVGWFTIVGRIQ